MSVKLEDMSSLAQLEDSLAKSDKKKQLIFKHSNTCPISTAAFNELNSYLKKSPDEDVDYWLIVVQNARNVSNEVAAKLGIKHESPQAILVHNKKAIWNKSHYDITQKSLKEAVAKEA